MVIVGQEVDMQADILFVVEGTGMNGAYLNDLKTNYILPTLEYFCQGSLDEHEYWAESTYTQYGLVVYHAADHLPHPSSDSYGPFSNPQRIPQMLERIDRLFHTKTLLSAHIDLRIQTVTCLYLSDEACLEASVKPRTVSLIQVEPRSVRRVDAMLQTGQMGAEMLLVNLVCHICLVSRRVALLYPLYPLYPLGLLVGGRGESHANVAEGLATALQCFEDMQARREPNTVPQKHCILVCSSPPYLMPVMESHNYAGHTVDQLAATLQERGIHLSILCPRKIPSLFKLYDKAGGDLQASLIKNYAKDPRHLVLLKGYSLKERPISPTNSGVIGLQSQAPGSVSMTSLPSPQTNLGSPMSVVAGVGPTQTPQGPTPQVSAGAVYRPNQNQPRAPYIPIQPGTQNNPTQGSALIAQLTQPPAQSINPVVLNQYTQRLDKCVFGIQGDFLVPEQLSHLMEEMGFSQCMVCDSRTGSGVRQYNTAEVLELLHFFQACTFQPVDQYDQ
uniref:Mediator of RNA polymerase II transcription subunit 25 n=1 Tax=Timema tahoe TaxID=61484 RepID=A0A7R9NZ63_9NEOP|nr:unnamed protein product [Timema tahoe]